MKTSKKAPAFAAMGVALAAGSLAWAPATASAAPAPAPQGIECNTWKSSSGRTGYASCTGMKVVQVFRVKLTCIDPRGNQWIDYGPWKRNAQTSSETCSSNPNVGVYKVGVSTGTIGALPPAEAPAEDGPISHDAASDGAEATRTIELASADGTASPAKLPDCNTWKSGSGRTGYAYCSGLGIADKFRVKLTCIDPRGNQWIDYGPWKRNAQTSSETCSSNPNVGVYKVGVAFNF